MTNFEVNGRKHMNLKLTIWSQSVESAIWRLEANTSNLKCTSYCSYSARHLNPTKSNSNGNLTDLVFRFFSQISTDLHGFPLISTDFYEFSRFSTDFPRISTDFLGFFTDFKQISALFSSLQLNYIVQKMLGEKNNMPLYTKYIINRVTNWN